MQEKLKHYKMLYDAAREAYEETLEGLDRSMEQYLGSPAIDGSREGANHVRNITYELIESELSPEIPTARVDCPCYSYENAARAEAAERLLKVVKDTLPLDEINDADERSTYIFGGSLLLVEWDRGLEDESHIPIKVRQISPRDFIPEPGVTSLDDMNYCFLRFNTTKGEVQRKYGISDDDILKCQCGYEYGESLSDDDTVTVISAFYHGEDGRVGQLIFSGDVLLSDIPDYYDNGENPDKVYITEDGKVIYKTPDIDKKSLQNMGKNPKKYSIEKYHPRTFPLVLRKNISAEGELYGRSDAQMLRHIQQAINKVESRIMQKLMRSGITPIMPEDATVTLSNAVFGQVIKIKSGESADSYGTVDTTPDISQDIEEADRLYDQAKRLIGISDAYQGIDYQKVESGYAKQLRINQAQGRLQSKRRMKIMAYERLYRIIFEHFLCFGSGVRHLAYKDGFGRVRQCDFSPLRHLSFDQKKGVFYLSCDLTFTADNEAGGELQREALWERNLKNLEAGTLGDKEQPETLLRYWQFQEQARYPGAKDNVEYFKALLGKGEKKDDHTHSPTTAKRSPSLPEGGSNTTAKEGEVSA